MTKGQTKAEAIAAKLTGPLNRHGHLVPLFGGAIGGGLPDEERPGIVEYACELRNRAEKARSGDLTDASDLLLSQALTLDGIFTETARRAAGNMAAGYLPAFEIYMRLAMKAQSQSRATLEALAKLHQPREQTVRHVHVNEGGQAIVADEFHSHTGGEGNAQSSKQPHAITAGGTGASASLSSPDAGRFTVPVASRERKEAVPNARRQGKRRAQGE